MEKTIVDYDIDIFSNKIGFIFNSPEDDYSREFQIISMGEIEDEEEDEMDEEEDEEELVDQDDPFFNDVDGFEDFNGDILQDIEDDFDIDEVLQDDFADEEEDDEENGEDELDEDDFEEFSN